MYTLSSAQSFALCSSACVFLSKKKVWFFFSFLFWCCGCCCCWLLCADNIWSHSDRVRVNEKKIKQNIINYSEAADVMKIPKMEFVKLYVIYLWCWIWEYFLLHSFSWECVLFRVSACVYAWFCCHSPLSITASNMGLVVADEYSRTHTHTRAPRTHTPSAWWVVSIQEPWTLWKIYRIFVVRKVIISVRFSCICIVHLRRRHCRMRALSDG